MSHDQVGIREGRDSDGDRCWFGWGTDMFMTGVRWTHDINENHHLCHTREEAQERLADMYDNEAEYIELKVAHLTEAAKQLREGAGNIRSNGQSNIVLSLAEHSATKKSKEEIDKRRKKAHLIKQLKELDE